MLTTNWSAMWGTLFFGTPTPALLMWQVNASDSLNTIPLWVLAIVIVSSLLARIVQRWFERKWKNGL